MDIDMISINGMTKEERERHFKDGLCFICHKSGHQSRDCSQRKQGGQKKAGGSKHGKGKGKGNRFNRRSIRNTTTGDGDEEEEEQSEPEDRESYTKIRALIKNLPHEERIRVLMDTDEDF